MAQSRFEVTLAKAQVCLEEAVVSEVPVQEGFLAALATFTQSAQTPEDNALQLKGLSSEDGGVVELGLRAVLGALVQGAATVQQPVMQYCHRASAQPSVPRLLDMALWLASVRQTDKGLVPGLVGLLEELVEMSTISDCQQVFSYMEAATPLLRQAELFAQAKLVLLRTCNLLLRRLSKGFHAQLCGRVLIFLAKLYPLSERSGVNLHGNVNIANVTLLEDLQPGAVDSNGEAVDVAFYKTLWGLQALFQRPAEAMAPARWTQAVADVRTLLKHFAATPIAVAGSTPWSQGGGEGLTVKYLSSSKLMRLQLRDAAFRRQLLVQALVFLHACHHPAKPDKAAKPDRLLSKQVAELQEVRGAVYRQLEGSPEGGPEFAAVVRAILADETKWLQWKRDGCPPFEKPPYQPPPPGRPRKKPRVRGGPAVQLGTAELDRLWNLTPDNLSCLAAGDRAPPLEAFLEPVITEMDPEEGIEDEYKTKQDKIYVWRALRLVARQDLTAFSKTTQAGDLDEAVRRLYPERVPQRAAPAQPPPSPAPLPSTPERQQDAAEDAPAEAVSGGVKEGSAAEGAGSKVGSAAAEVSELEAGEVQDGEAAAAESAEAVPVPVVQGEAGTVEGMAGGGDGESAEAGSEDGEVEDEGTPADGGDMAVPDAKAAGGVFKQTQKA